MVSLQKKLSIKDQVEADRPIKEKTPAITSSPGSPPKILPSTVQPKVEYHSSAVVDSVPVRKPSFNGTQQIDRPASLVTSSQITNMSKPETQKTAIPKPAEKAMAQQAPVMSRPSSAPLIPGPRPTAPVVSMVQTAPLLARSVSAAGRLGPDPSPATHSYVPQSYRNAIIGNHVASSSAGYTNANASSSGVNQPLSYSQPPALVSSPMFLPQGSERMDPSTVKSGFPYGMMPRDGLLNGVHWMESSQRESSKSRNYDPSSLLNDVQNLDFYRSLPSGSREHLSSEFSAGTSGRQNQGVSADEFPHLDIINDLLDDEYVIGAARGSSVFNSLSNNGPNHLNRQYSFPGELGAASDMGSSSSSCRFERTRSYDDGGFQRSYSSSGSHYESLREYVPQASHLPYVNGQIDGLIQNQWPMAGSDLSLLGMRNAECEGYPYYNPEYSNLACNANGYTVFRPSNGH